MKSKIKIRQRSLIALKDFPYFVLRNEIEGDSSYYRDELIEIKQAYLDYKEGAEFTTEGSAGDYVPSSVKFKLASSIINKEARFMFSQKPDINITISDTSEEGEQIAKAYQTLIDKVTEKSHFARILLQSAKDCFIGKRIAFLADMSERDGILIHAYNSMQFFYSTEPGTDRLIKFVAFERVHNCFGRKKMFLVNKYEEEQNKVYVSSVLYDSSGNEEEVLIERKETGLSYIPAFIVINDGTLEDKHGISEMLEISDYESTYSRLANADIDSERKGMNPIRYTVDMNSQTTKNLSSGAGAYWDLKTEQNQNDVHPLIGTLSPSLEHSEPLKATLNRIKSFMYNAVDMPDISEDTLVGTITSGKALKALYYPLEVRCDEKMITWESSIRDLMRAVIDIALLNQEIVKELYQVQNLTAANVDIVVEKNYALLEDENEEKEMDLAEINANARSRASYIKKWRSSEIKTEQQIEQELMQIAVELNMFDSMSVNTQVQEELNRKAEEQKLEEDLEEIETEQNL